LANPVPARHNPAAERPVVWIKVRRFIFIGFSGDLVVGFYKGNVTIVLEKSKQTTIKKPAPEGRNGHWIVNWLLIFPS
jgi:hypothetical protein